MLIKRILTCLLALMAIALGAQAKTYKLNICDGNYFSQKDQYVITALVFDDVLDVTSSGSTKIYKKKGSSSTLFSITNQSLCAVPTEITCADDFTTSLSAQAQGQLIFANSSLSGTNQVSVFFYVAVNEQNFPDKNFRDYILSNWDANGDQRLSKEECTPLDMSMNIKSKNISNLKGIEYFTSLVSLDCSNNKLTSLDVSACTALTDFAFYGNQIEEAAMEDLVTGLPTVSAGKFCVVDLSNTDEGNVITKKQVEAANAKGWTVHAWDGNGVVNYETAPVPGDVNGDDKVNGTDLVALANIILGKNPEIPAADVNGDGNVNGTDYVALVNIILGTATASQMTADTEDTAGIASTLYVAPFSISAGETKEIAVRLTNPNDELTLLQFDLSLPEGLTVNKADEEYEIDMDGRTSWQRHQLTAYVNDNSIRCLLASNSNATIDGTEGTVVRLTVTASHDFAGGTMTLHDILGVTPTEREVWMTDSHLVLSANGTTGIGATSMDHGKWTMDNVYDLNGRASKSLKKGINIVEGKKILKK